ncbi:MAG: hypothetical protein ABIY35_06855 [Chitinophagaceae bacterium]
MKQAIILHRVIRNVFAMMFFLCAMLFIPHHAFGQLKKLKEKVSGTIKKTGETVQNPIDAAKDTVGGNVGDDQQILSDAYSCYVSEVERFDRRSANEDAAVQHAKEEATKLNGFLKRRPQYHKESLKHFYDWIDRDITGDELLNGLLNARQIIDKGFVDETTTTNSYFIQGDVDMWKRRTDNLESNDGFVEMAKTDYPLLFNRAKGEANLLDGYSKGAGKTLPASAIKPMHDQISELLKKMADLAPKYSPEPSGGAIESNVQGLVKSGAASYLPGATLIHAVWSPNQSWLIDKNSLGVPINRRREGTALYKMANEKYCIEQHFFYLENYAGNGNYTSGDDVQFADVRFVKCQ